MQPVNPLRSQKEMYGRTFLLALGVAAVFFLPFILMNEGYFIFYGDFNVQQIPFYQMCHDKVRSGEIFWNWNTDLGVNFIGSYSFYLLGSPFFWLTLPFPSWMVPYLMGPLLILKFACAAFTAYFYIRRFVKTPQSAMLGGLLYAFSGFAVYNIFFNHFHEAIIFFPLLLTALEMYIAENKRGPLVFATFICALSNYFFFFGMAVFCVIYWFVRMLANRWSLSLGRLLWMVVEILLGVALAAFLLLPAFYSVMQNDRVTSTLMGWNALLYGRPQIYLNIIEVFFFPPDLPARPVFFTDADVKWASLGAWLPVLGMTGVIAWLQSKKGNWLRRLIIILAVMAMVPILNSAFYAFNSAYYARWFYMPVLMMSLATVLTLEDRSVDWGRGLKWSAVITGLFTLLVGLTPTGVDDQGNIKAFGLFSSSDKVGGDYFIKFWVTCGIAIVSLVLTAVLYKMRRRSFRRMMNAAVAMVCVVSVIYAAVFVGTGKSQSYDPKEVVIDQLIEGEVDLPDQGKNDYRIDVFDGVDNTGMYLGYPCIQAFHSIVPASVTNFYEYCGVERGVGSRPETEFAALRPLLSVKYLLDRSGGDDFVASDGEAEMPGWSYAGSQSGYRIYENENYIPYGFTYDYYMTWDQCDAYGEENRSHMMLKAILLSDEQIERHQDILTPLSKDYDVLGDSESASLSGKSGSRQIYFTDSALAADSAARAETASTDFTGTSNGFTATVDLERENLVFFSVPYEEDGWTAYIDGQTVEIEQVNIGFMAVRVAAGQHSIEFRYKTPGLLTGMKISVVALAATVVYLLVIFYRRRQSPAAFAVEYPEGEELDASIAGDAWLIGEFTPPEEGSPAPALDEALAAAFSEESAEKPSPPVQTEISGDPPSADAESAVQRGDTLPEAEDDWMRQVQEGVRKRRRHAKGEPDPERKEPHLLDRLFSEPEESGPVVHGVEGGFTVHIEEEKRDNQPEGMEPPDTSEGPDA